MITFCFGIKLSYQVVQVHQVWYFQGGLGCQYHLQLRESHQSLAPRQFLCSQAFLFHLGGQVQDHQKDLDTRRKRHHVFTAVLDI